MNSESKLTPAQLETGKIYDIILIKLFNKPTCEENQLPNKCFNGQSIYIGGTLKRKMVNRHIIVIDREIGIRSYSFEKYPFVRGKLKIPSVREIFPSSLEKNFLKVC